MLFFLVGPYKGRRPRRSQQKAYLRDGIRKNLLHYGLEYDKEEAELFAEQILEQARSIQQCERARAEILQLFPEDFTLNLSSELAQAEVFDQSLQENGQDGFEIG